MRKGLFAGVAAIALVAVGCGDRAVDLKGDDLAPKGVELPAELPEPRTEVAGAAWNGRIVVVGGLTADGRPSSRADSFDPDVNRWKRLPDLPRPLHHTAVVVFEGRAWAIGGYTLFEGDAWVPVRTAFSLGEDEGEWRSEPEMKEIRGALAAAVVGDRIVAGGGHDGTNVLATTEVLRSGADAWEPGPAMQQAREHFALAVVGDDLYAVAGRVPDNLDSVEVLREGAERWEPGPGLHHSRSGIGAATVDGTACVAGGEEPGGTIAPVECLSDGRWEVVGELKVPRHGLAVVALGERLHVIGGGPRPGLTVSGTHEVMEPSRRVT